MNENTWKRGTVTARLKSTALIATAQTARTAAAAAAAGITSAGAAIRYSIRTPSVASLAITVSFMLSRLLYTADGHWGYITKKDYDVVYVCGYGIAAVKVRDLQAQQYPHFRVQKVLLTVGILRLYMSVTAIYRHFEALHVCDCYVRTCTVKLLPLYRSRCCRGFATNNTTQTVDFVALISRENNGSKPPLGTQLLMLL